MSSCGDVRPIGHRWAKYGDYVRCVNCTVMKQDVTVKGSRVHMYWVSGLWTAERPNCGVH